MARMHVEVFDALRSVMPEEKAIQGAVALYDAITMPTSTSVARVAQREAGLTNLRSEVAELAPEFSGLRSDVSSLRTDMRILVWIMGANLMLVTVLLFKVWFG